MRALLSCLLLWTAGIPGAGQAAQAPPERIVCLSPSLTETVASLGCAARLVGVSDYAVWPPSALELPRLGGLYNANLETLLRLEPELVLIPSPVPALQTVCARAGITVAQVPMENLDDVWTGIIRVATLLGCPDRGHTLVSQIRGELDTCRAGEEPGVRRRVLLVLDRPASSRLQQLTVIGPGTFFNQLLTLVGGTNVFADATQRYFTPSLEQVLVRTPDLIIELRPEVADLPALEADLSHQWHALFGGKESPHVTVLVGKDLLIPGPRLALIAERLAEALETGSPP